MEGRTNRAFRRLALCAAPLVMIWGIAGAHAQDATASATAPAQTQSQTANDQTFSQAQIAQLVAPIALYPDPLLSQVLMASTYPLEIVEAARWSSNNPGVTGQALQDAMQAQSWDPSVKALTSVPQTLQMLSSKLDWTQQLGDAFLADQQAVMSAVQTLRAQAQAAGNLQSNAQQVVSTQPAPADVVASGAPQPIVIQPTDPNVYYVPVYNPAVAYGNWTYPSYPPFYWSPPGFIAGNVISFAAGVSVGAAIWGGCNWWTHSVNINVNNYNIFNRTHITNNIWNHDPAHRDGVPYRNEALARRFHQDNEPAMRRAAEERMHADHGNLFGNRTNAARPDNFRRNNADAGRRFAPANRDRGNAGIRRNGGDRRIGRAAPQRRNIARPGRSYGNRQAARMRSFRSARAFRPNRPAFRMQRRMGGGFHFHGGGGRRRI